MALWLQTKIPGLSLHTEQSGALPCQPNNPYTFSLCAIGYAFCRTVNDAFEFAESSEEIDPVDAEIKRIRYESELVIYAARFCEAAIKQMLYCTSFSVDLYEKATMGQLLSRHCEACGKGKEGHDISLLGALAHRFFLCPMLDGCAIDHLLLVARRRNLEAAHSDSQFINPRTAAESRAHLNESALEIGYELGHMADHIGAIEAKMIAETELFIKSGIAGPTISDLSNIPVRATAIAQYHPEVLEKLRRSGQQTGNRALGDVDPL
jgi:hypothetical protein